MVDRRAANRGGTPVRIALFHNLPSGGAKRHTREQARELARRGHEVVEFRPSTAAADFCSLAPHVAAVHSFPAPALSRLARRVPLLTPYIHAAQGLAALRRVDRLQQRIAAVIDAGRFDVTLVQDCQVAMTPYLLRYLQTPAAFFCHHGFTHWSPPLRAAGATGRETMKARYYAPARWLFSRTLCRDERRNAQCAGVVLTASRFAHAQVQAHYAVDAVVVGAGVDPAVFAPVAAPPSDYVLCVGELSPRKDYPFLVKALARLPIRRRPRLLIAANAVQADEAAALAQLAEARGVALERVRTGNDGELAALYAGARAFVYAPREEMLGLACLEAMSCATPVVAVRDGGVAEMVLDGVTGWLTERDADAFAARLDTLLTDEALRARMGAAAAEHVRAAWTWPDAVDRVEVALIQEVARGR